LKKALPYILIPMVVIIMALIVFNNITNRQVFNERITLREKDKNPYGYFIAKNLVASIFPNADIFSDKRPPLEWDSLSSTAGNQAIIIVANQFRVSQRELNDLHQFASNGNHVFIIQRNMSYDARLFFDLYSGALEGGDPVPNDKDDTLVVTLSIPRFTDTKEYFYPGKRYAGYYTNLDTSKLIILGRNEFGLANFVQYKAGAGAIYIHAAPLAFSNYFLLQPHNIEYFEKVFSVIPSTVNKLVWNEYYLVKNNQRQSEPNWLGVLFQYPSLRWALLTAIAALLIFTLLESRRRQKVIPSYSRPANDSLDFVKTVGRLYYDKKDHKNLVTKMSSFFLDHVRTRYQLSTTNLDASFMEALHAKTNYSKDKINSIIQSITYSEEKDKIDEEWMYNFHKQLEAFYQNT
jgi:hypothetical protein